jgi:LysM repeat protein
MKTRSLSYTCGLGLALILVVLSALPGQPTAVEAAPAGQTGNYITVVVKAGESLATYARLYGTSGAALLAANPQIKDANLIYPGQALIIPVIKTFTPSLTTPFYYTVQAGDNIYAIGRRFHMDANTIALANGIKNNIVILGQTYLIPAGPHYHIVQKYETLDTIARQYGASMEAMQTFNDIPNPYQLFIGQYVYIPVIYDAQPMPIIEPAPTPTSAATLTSTPVPGATAALVPSATPVPGATAAPVPSATPNVTPSVGNYIVITIRLGENLVTYTYRYGVSGASLLAANPQMKEPNVIYPGDHLTIPVVVSFTPSRSTPFFYTLTAADALFTVAAKFEIMPEVITKANPGVTLVPGATILIPAGPHVYTVKAGDDLRAIAAKYSTTVDFILKGNDLPNPDRIYPGQLIFIPLRYNAAPVPFTP